MAVGAQAIAARAGHDLRGGGLRALAHEGHDLDGLGALVVAALDRLAVGVVALVLAVVHAADALARGLGGGGDSGLRLRPAPAQALREGVGIAHALEGAEAAPRAAHDLAQIVLHFCFKG